MNTQKHKYTNKERIRNLYKKTYVFKQTYTHIQTQTDLNTHKKNTHTKYAYISAACIRNVSDISMLQVLPVGLKVC